MSLFDFELIAVQIGPDELLQHFSEEMIYSQYYPEFKLGVVCSPFRDDNNASFSIYNKHGVGDILWYDQATGEKGNCFTFVQKMLKYRGEDLSMKEVYQRIYQDLKGGRPFYGSGERKATTVKPKSRPKVSGTIIQAVLDDAGLLPEHALWYWERLGITRNILEQYHVGYAKQIFLIKHFADGTRSSKLWAESTPDNPIYFYYFPQTKHMKAYRPLEKNKKEKWISNVTNSKDVQGYYQCMIKERKPDLLVLTKSMKDVMWLRSIGVDSMAIHGENHTFSADFIDHLRRHCKHIISLYDNDRKGKQGAWTLRKLYNIPAYFIPNCYKAKDITDMYLLDKDKLFLLIEILKLQLDADHH